MRNGGRRRRPSVLFVNQHYHPDVAATGQLLTDLAEFLAADGWDVEVLCGRGRYTSVAPDSPARERRNGVAIRRLGITRFGRHTYLGRMLDYLTFYAQVLVRLLVGRRRDCVVMLTTPPLLALCGVLLKRLRGGRYGVWSMDLHPDIEVALGVLKEGGVATRVLQALDRLAYREADFVVALDPQMGRRIRERGVPDSRLATLPVWNRKDEIRPVKRADNPLARELGLNGEFVVMYSGNAGLVHRFEEVLEAMRRLRDRPELMFLFVGAGPRRREIVDFVWANDIGNFRYLEYFPRERLVHSLSLADLHLVTQRVETIGSVFPSKLYGVMAASRPTLFVGPPESEAAQTILEAECGAVVDPRSQDAADRLCDLLLELQLDRERARALGGNGRRAFLRSFEQERVCRDWNALLWRTARARSPALTTLGPGDLSGARPPRVARTGLRTGVRSAGLTTERRNGHGPREVAPAHDHVDPVPAAAPLESSA